DVGRNLLKAGQGVPLEGNFGSFYNSVGIKPASGQGNVDPAVLQRQIALEQQRIGILGNLAHVQQQVRTQELAIAQARNQGVKITEQEEQALLAYARATALGTLQIRQQADSERINAATIGLSAGATAAYRAEQERLADFRRRGITLTQDQAKAIKDEA